MGCRLALVAGWCLGFPARVLVDVDFLLLRFGSGGWLLGIFRCVWHGFVSDFWVYWFELWLVDLIRWVVGF